MKTLQVGLNWVWTTLELTLELTLNALALNALALNALVSYPWLDVAGHRTASRV